MSSAFSLLKAVPHWLLWHYHNRVFKDMCQDLRQNVRSGPPPHGKIPTFLRLPLALRNLVDTSTHYNRLRRRWPRCPASRGRRSGTARWRCSRTTTSPSTSPPSGPWGRRSGAPRSSQTGTTNNSAGAGNSSEFVFRKDTADIVLDNNKLQITRDYIQLYFIFELRGNIYFSYIFPCLFPTYFNVKTQYDSLSNR